LVIPYERRLTQRWGFPAPSRRVARPDAPCVGELLALGTTKGGGPRLAWSIRARNAIRRNSANRPQSKENVAMWYFSWILGVGLACSFAILNAMWFELNADATAKKQVDQETPLR
jgi:cytochrome bd-I ubiquinol oxidase subunit X